MLAQEQVRKLGSKSGLSGWERGFLKSIYSQLQRNKKLSERQISKLKEISGQEISFAPVERKKAVSKVVEVKSQKTTVNIPKNIMAEVKSLLDGTGQHNIYLFGSQVYGTTTEDSDYDFLVVSESENRPQFLSKNFDITYKTAEMVMDEISRGNINTIEALTGLVEGDLNLDGAAHISYLFVRNALMQARSSFRKGARWIESDLAFERYKGKKSLFHSLRILKNMENIIKEKKILIEEIRSVQETTKRLSVDEIKVELERGSTNVWNSFYS